MQLIENSVDGEFAQHQNNSYLLPFSVLQPYKHLTSCLGLLRSRPDPFRRSKIEQDKTSTIDKRLVFLASLAPLNPLEAR